MPDKQHDDYRKPTTTEVPDEVGGEPGEHVLADAAFDKIRRRAYQIWDREGRPIGRQREHWAQAEREILEEAGIQAGPGDAEGKEQ